MASTEFYIFRDSRKRAAVDELVSALGADVRRLAEPSAPDQLITLLLRAGELECGLSDAPASSAVCEQAACLTDLFAAATLARDPSSEVAANLRGAALAILERINYEHPLSVGAPEGFAYYALHPLDYSDLVSTLELNAASALVIGVRSIGTTLSAVVAAGLRELGVSAARVTVRPIGHPYDRVTEFDAAQRQAIDAAIAEESEIFICDEGPGRSGSSLLSVAEALEQAGAERTRIRILCAHQPDPGSLCARDARQRWTRYSSSAVGMTRRLPADAAAHLDSIARRSTLFRDRGDCPAAWPQLERLSYTSADGRRLLTFEGHGHYGGPVHARHQALSNAGWGAPCLGHDAGFGSHLAVLGRALRREDLSSRLLTHMAEYCAWRARTFSARDVEAFDLATDLETMTRVNFEREFGGSLPGFSLLVERPAICDARMMPHEWLMTEDDRWIKLDAAIHGDDHFFPGPCDIAWDLAGIVVEWNLPGAARGFLLSEYRKAAGEDASARMPAYELAYATFRTAWSRMAAASVGDPEEESRLRRDYRKYREFLVKLQPREASLSTISESHPALNEI